jgi:outer membrane protein
MAAVFIMAAALHMPFLANAQDATPIVVLNIPELLDKTSAGQAAKKTIESEIAKRKEAIERVKKQFDSLRDDYQRQESMLSAEARTEKQQALRAKEDELRQLLARDENEMVLFQGEQVEKIMKDVDKVLANLAEELGFKFVVEKEPTVVLYQADRLDITKRVISELENG